MEGKKATIEIQFNWIFVLIVGVVILGAFVGISRAIQKGATQGMQYDTLTYLDEIFTGAETSVDSVRDVKLSGTDITIDCNAYSVKGSGFEGQNIQARPIFSPDTIRGSALSYASYWETPFKASSFLYLTSPGVDYVLVGGDLARKLNSTLPVNIRKTLIEESGLDDYRNQNNYKIRLVFFGADVATPPPVPTTGLKIIDGEISAVKIAPPSPETLFPEGYGQMQFYRKNGDVFEADGGPIYYMGKASLIGGVYAESREMYECNMKKALKRLSLISDNLDRRLGELQATANNPSCQYAEPRQRLQLIRDKSKMMEADSSLADIYIASYGSSGLREENTNLQRFSCPVVY